MTAGPQKLGGLPAAATLLSLLACYGTAAVIAALGILGIGVALNDHVWAAAIVFLALLAAFALAISRRVHGGFWPLVVGLSGFLVITYAMYGHYSRLTELAGFALLCLAAAWDWRQQKTMQDNSGC